MSGELSQDNRVCTYEYNKRCKFNLHRLGREGETEESEQNQTYNAEGEPARAGFNLEDFENTKPEEGYHSGNTEENDSEGEGNKGEMGEGEGSESEGDEDKFGTKKKGSCGCQQRDRSAKERQARRKENIQTTYHVHTTIRTYINSYFIVHSIIKKLSLGALSFRFNLFPDNIMVVIRPYETSSSTTYDVFLSFRGEDTRYTFTDHLYRALDQHGFRTFRDEDEMRKGERLKSELEKAIPQSKSSTIVISENYANSSWCLDELVMILERRRTSGHVVLPVFYHVEPSEVRKQTGTIADAFEKYKKQCDKKTDTEGKRTWMEKIQRWRSALTEVADLIGHHHVDGYESKLIDKIIKDTKVNVRRTPLYMDPYIIGIDSQVEEINLWLQDGSNNDRVLAVCGMGGIGKTTIAKIVYNQNFESFDGSSFITVTNIGEKSKHPELQQQFISNITKRNHGNIHSVHAGLEEIRNLVFSKRVLLFLDDVEEVDRVYDILGRPEWFLQGSKVIITTRHERMLQPHQMLKVEILGQDESIKLFSLTAFKKDFPPEIYTKHTIRAVQICERLPLALKVLGTSLSRKRKDEWIPELTKLESIPQREILEILKISYDSLHARQL
ncbi:hypothetical protein LguiA_008172 [Lonicera macranthoides]